jgi:hypothetical protein
LTCRAGEDGQLTRESNARFVKWSDGSESIMLGDEVLNVDRQVHARAHTYLYAVSDEPTAGIYWQLFLQPLHCTL